MRCSDCASWAPDCEYESTTIKIKTKLLDDDKNHDETNE